jgi:hypothetical protein
MKIDPASQLKARRADILAEYRFYNLEPMRIGGEPISLELALVLGLLVETPPATERQEAAS